MRVLRADTRPRAAHDLAGLRADDARDGGEGVRGVGVRRAAVPRVRARPHPLRRASVADEGIARPLVGLLIGAVFEVAAAGVATHGLG